MIELYYETVLGKLYCGNCLGTLQQLPNESVDCVMTSPPYWGLRDYGIEPQIWDGDESCKHEWQGKDGQASSGQYCTKCNAWKGSLGLEPTFQLYIQHMIQIFNEIKRILKPTGTCWVNMGDVYGNGNKLKLQGDQGGIKAPIGQFAGTKYPSGGIEKSLCQIPQRFSIAMVDNDWILRNVIIWHKPNSMPQPAKDRFTVDFEYLYFFAKNKKYWFEQQFNKRPLDSIKRDYRANNQRESQYAMQKQNKNTGYGEIEIKDRNKRCVWTIPTQSFPEAHFAVYPETLCHTPIKAGCPEDGVVLDPFAGAGTTLLMAEKLNRKWIGIEISKKYCDIISERLNKETSQLKLELA